MSARMATDTPQTALYRQLDQYPWENDHEFQGGLQAILGSVHDPAQVDHLTLRAKCYYYARKFGAPVDFDGYKQWTENRRRDQSAQRPAPEVDAEEVPACSDGTTEANGPTVKPDAVPDGIGKNPHKPASFAEICDLIAEGKPIPGIKDIPTTILEGQASESQAQERKKPWERGDRQVDVQGEANTLSWMT